MSFHVLEVTVYVYVNSCTAPIITPEPLEPFLCTVSVKLRRVHILAMSYVRRYGVAALLALLLYEQDSD